MSPTCDWQLIIVKLTVLVMQGMRLTMYLRGFDGLLVFLSLVEEENNVGNAGNVGNVAQSEKSPHKSQ